MVKAFDLIKNAGTNGDGKRARSAWKIASATLSGYLDEVGQPTSLDDSSYNELTKIHVQNDIKTELISHL